jgi:hypothetical protein
MTRSWSCAALRITPPASLNLQPFRAQPGGAYQVFFEAGSGSMKIPAGLRVGLEGSVRCCIETLYSEPFLDWKKIKFPGAAKP